MRFIYRLAVAFLALTGLAATCAGANPAGDFYREGQRAERAGDSLRAYLLFAQAASLEPQNATYAAAKANLQRSGQVSGRALPGDDPADETMATALLNDLIPEGERIEMRPTVGAPRLVGPPDRKSFDLRGDARMIFETVAKAYGFEVEFEADYQTPPPFTFRVTDLTYQEALHTLEGVANSFVVPRGERSLLVARDSPQSRAEKSPVVSIAIPIPARISNQDAQEIIAAVQQTLEVRRITVDPDRRVVYLRDTAAKVNAARLLFGNLSRLRTQVEVEVEFLSVSKQSSLVYGLSLPSATNLVNFGTFLKNKPSIPAGFMNFLTFGGGATFLGMGIGDAVALATLSRSSNNILLQSQMVMLDGQLGTLHVGDHFPVITNGYYGNATGTGQVYSPPPTVSFEDLGLVLRITPSVHGQNEVSLDVDAQFKVLGGSSSNGIPIIASRSYQGKVRLGGGEWAVVAGLVSLSDSQTQAGIAGLSDLPGIGRILRRNDHQTESNQVLLILKPRIVSVPPSEVPTNSIWLGTEGKPLTLY